MRVRQVMDDDGEVIRLIAAGSTEMDTGTGSLPIAHSVVLIAVGSGKRQRAWIVAECSKPPHCMKSGAVDKALRELVDLGKLHRPGRGSYERVGKTRAPK